MTKSKQISFIVDGQLIGELGQRLVTRNHVAMAELIKNAYDADATDVEVIFKNLRDPNGSFCSGIEIKDNGLGMSMEVIEKHWMRIATANKQDELVSIRYGRPRTGSKGIGRFSCERLARYLHLITTAKVDGELQTIEAWFDWDKFKPGTNLADIEISFNSAPTGSGKCGTTLRLVDLRDDWTQSQFDTLARAVMSLTVTSAARRKNYKADPGFSIKIESDQFNTPEPDLFERLINAGWGRMKAKISNNGKVTIELNGKYLDQPRRITLKKTYSRLSGVKFDIGFLRDGEGYELNRNTKVLTKKLLSQFRDQGGVRVYFEGFRVYPYGEPGNDWLLLDRDYARRSSGIIDPAIQELASSMRLTPRDVGLLKPRNANLLGQVHLDQQSASHMATKMSREGFIDSAALTDLISVIRTAIEWATVHYAYARQQHVQSRRLEIENRFIEAIKNDKGDRDGKVDSKPLTEAIHLLTKYASSALPSDTTEPRLLVEKIEAAKSVITANIDEKEEEIDRLRTLASTAPLLFTFTHEVYSLISQLDTHASTIRNITKKLTNEEYKDALIETADDLKSTGSNFRSVATLFGILNASNDSDSRRHYVKPLLENIIKGTQFALRESSIDVNIVCDRDTKTPRMKKPEFVSIVINLYVNALKSTMAAKGRQIEIRCFNRESDFVLEVLDQGVGLRHRFRKSVFEPFISDPENKIYSRLNPNGKLSSLAPIGQGSGLGLSIIKGIVSNKNGYVEFFDESDWSIGIRTVIPRTKP